MVVWKKSLLGLELVWQDQVRVPQQISIYRYCVLANIEFALVAHDWIEDC